MLFDRFYEFYYDDSLFADDEDKSVNFNEKSNFTDDEEKEFKAAVMFEPDFEVIKNNPESMFIKYTEKLDRLINNLAYNKNFEADELFQETYIYFMDLCKSYEPYHNGYFFPFDRYVFKNIIFKVRAYIQRFYFKQKREMPNDSLAYDERVSPRNNVRDCENRIYFEYINSLISPLQREVLELSVTGFKQREIGEFLNISQSRVSVIRKKTLDYLKAVLKEKKEITQLFRKL